MDDYDTVHMLGSGACGSVYLVRQKSTTRLFALKKIQLDEKRRNRTKSAVLKEAKILAQLKHPNIVAYNDSFFDNSGEYLCIVQDYCDGGSLDDKIQETARKKEFFSEKQVIRWFIQLTMAVQYMHSKRILHRDLKTQNVFMNKSGTTCKLGDFGISKMMEATIDLASTCVGTPCYLAPEMCQDIPYSSKADVWALGCLLFEMCSLRPAFEAHNLISLFYKIIKDDIQPLPEKFSAEMAVLVSTVLSKSPDDRPSARQILTLPYVKENLAEFIVELMSANEQRDSPVKSAKSRAAPDSSRPDTRHPPILNRCRSVELSPRSVRKEADRLRLSQTMDSAIKLCIPQTEKTPRRVPVNVTPRREAKHQCLMCGKSFGMAIFLSNHIKKSHEGPETGVQAAGKSPARQPELEPQYEDDFEYESDRESEDEIIEELNHDHNKDDEIEEVLSQGSGEDTDDEYDSDFEEYDSDDDLDGMMQHAQEMQGDMSEDEETVMDEEPSGIIQSYKGLLQEHAIARLGTEKYKQLTEKRHPPAVTAEDIKMRVMHRSEDEHVETCFLVELLHDQT